jgi:DNA-binding phage protein
LLPFNKAGVLLQELLLPDGTSPFEVWFNALGATQETEKKVEEEIMALTKQFKETVAARLATDPAFAHALLDEAITLFINGEYDTAKLVLRDLINATIGFEFLAEQIQKPSKSLHRMLSASGNPTMANISSIFAALQDALNVEVRTEVVA